MISGQFCTALFAVGTLLQLIACTNLDSIKPLSEVDGQNNEFALEESKLFNKSHDLYNNLKRRGLIYRDDQANRYIQKIGFKLTPDYLRQNDYINIHILKNAIANASALPNGDIYINTGLLAVVENEDQLASILAHEIGHIVHRHSLKSSINRKDTIVSAQIANLLLIGMGISHLAAASNLAEFSREQEKEADISGLDTHYSSGYVPEQAVEIIRIFQKLPGIGAVKGSVYSTHPENKARIDYLSQIVKRKYPGHNREITKTSEFDKVRRKIVELNVKISLANNNYSLALYLLDQAETYYNKQPLIEYYRGELYRLMAINPRRAAEDASIAAGKSVSDEEVLNFKKAVSKHLSTSRQHYNNALAAKPELALTYRGLGLLEMVNNNNELALQYLTKYLELTGKPKDWLYIKRTIKNLRKS